MYRAAKGARSKEQREAGREADVPWVERLSPNDQARVRDVRPAYNQYMRLKHNRKASRKTWLA